MSTLVNGTQLLRWVTGDKHLPNSCSSDVRKHCSFASCDDTFVWMMAFCAVSAASQWVREALWSIITGHWGLPWGFPFLLSGSRRWDHRTSLHRWQLRLKVSRSRGAYRLLVRCEILPCMLCLLVPDLLLHWEMGCHSLPPGVSLQFEFYCFSDQKRKEQDAPTHPSFFHFFSS